MMLLGTVKVCRIETSQQRIRLSERQELMISGRKSGQLTVPELVKQIQPARKHPL